MCVLRGDILYFFQFDVHHASKQLDLAVMVTYAQRQMVGGGGIAPAFDPIGDGHLHTALGVGVAGLRNFTRHGLCLGGDETEATVPRQ